MPSPLARATDAAGDAVRRILAYHGSPHIFDRFDASKIGTGEGAQRYGHGLYFSQTPDVAEWYRDNLTGAGQETPQIYAERVWRHFANDAAGSGLSDEAIHGKAMEAIQQAAVNHTNNAMSRIMAKKAADYLAGKSGMPPPLQRKGAVYEVEIGHPESSLIDYDNPLRSQGGVRAARIMADSKQASAFPATASQIKNLESGNWRYEVDTEPYRKIAESLKDNLLYDDVVSELARSGVPGIRYLDGTSRSAGQGTRNYVMFPGTEDSITILRKYGLLPAVGAGAAAASQMESQ